MLHLSTGPMLWVPFRGLIARVILPGPIWKSSHDDLNARDLDVRARTGSGNDGHLSGVAAAGSNDSHPLGGQHAGAGDQTDRVKPPSTRTFWPVM